MDRVPARIPEPDRTWMALAAYNVGINHLEDARIITQAQGADPDKWNDLKERLPLLAKAAWYTKTKHGYARGYEPVRLVNRVRTYYEVLKKNDNDSRERHNSDVAPEGASTVAVPEQPYIRTWRGRAGTERTP